jgi:isopentenyl-diphosphate Delta-isomerase
LGQIERLVLTDDRNRSIGWGEKLHVHEAGLLHRAFSIFLVDREGAIALQKRHPAKYHSGGLWANTCCGHPRPGEATMRAARRRLFEEVGVAADLTLAFRSRYAVAFENGLSENEIVNVYVGSLTGTPRPHPDEVVAIEMLTIDELAGAVARRPAAYAFWLRHYLRHHRPALEEALRRVVARAGGAATDRRTRHRTAAEGGPLKRSAARPPERPARG